MISADPEFYIRRKLSKTDQGTSFFDPGALAEYIRCIKDPKTVYGMCEDYRATFGVDLDMDTADFEAGKKVTCPGDDPVGQEGRRRPQPRCGQGLVALRQPDRAHGDGAVGTLSAGRMPGRDLYRIAEFLRGLTARNAIGRSRRPPRSPATAPVWSAPRCPRPVLRG